MALTTTAWSFPTDGLWASALQLDARQRPLADVLVDISLVVGVPLKGVDLPESKLTYSTQGRPPGELLTAIAETLGGEWSQDASGYSLRRSKALYSEMRAASKAVDQAHRESILLVGQDLRKGSETPLADVKATLARLRSARTAVLSSSSADRFDKASDLAEQIAQLESVQNPAAWAMGRSNAIRAWRGDAFQQVDEIDPDSLRGLGGPQVSRAVLGFGFDGAVLGGRLVVLGFDGSQRDYVFGPVPASLSTERLPIEKLAESWANLTNLPAFPKGVDLKLPRIPIPLDWPLSELARANRIPLVVAADLAPSTFVPNGFSSQALNDAIAKTEGYFRKSSGWIMARSRNFWTIWDAEPSTFRVDLLAKSDYSMENVAGFVASWPGANERLQRGNILLPLDPASLLRARPALQLWNTLTGEQRAALRERQTLPYRTLSAASRAAARDMMRSAIANPDLQSAVFSELLLAMQQGQFEDFEVYFDQFVDPQFEFEQGGAKVSAPFDMTPMTERQPQSLKGRRRQAMLFGLDSKRCVRIGIDVPLVR